MKRFSWTSPFLFTLAFLLYTYNLELHLVSPDQVVRLTIFLWLLLGLLYYPVYRVFKEWAAILLTIFVFGFYFSQLFFYLAGAVVLIAIVFYLAYARLRRLKVSVDQISLVLSIAAVSIIFFALYLNTIFFTRVSWPTYWRFVDQAKNYSIPIPSSPSDRPDIYYIILDGYSRSDLLRELYGYDNAPFVTYLQEKGFFVPSQVHSNYVKTALSVPSTLNMDYIHSFSPGLEKSVFWWLMKPFIDHSRVRTALEAQGYTTIAISGNWTTTDNRTTDIYLHPYPVMLTDFDKYFLDHTPSRNLMPLLENSTSVPTYHAHRSMNMYALETIGEIPDLPGPKFVYVHLISPHPPFVFDRYGNPIDPPYGFSYSDANDFEGTSADYKKGYINQVEFLNARMRVAIDAILAKSKTPPIIIIQADHGSGLLTNFTSVEKTCLKERFSPFAAYYLPGSPDIPSDITPVNLFRIVFNQYFNAQLPILENRQYFSRGVHLYNFVDVTSSIEKECNDP